MMTAPAALAYWESAISQPCERLDIPSAQPHKHDDVDVSMGNLDVSFTESQTLVDKIANNSNVPPEAVCVALFSILLYRHTAKTQFCVGYVSSNGLQSSSTDSAPAQLFPVSIVLSPSTSARDHIELVSKAFSIGSIDDYKTFNTVIEQLSNPEDAQSISCNEAAMAFGDSPLSSAIGEDVELFMHVMHANDTTTLSARYSKQRFSEATVQRLLNHFQQLLESLATNPDAQVSNLSMLNEPEHQQLLVDFNDSARAYASDSTVVDLFMEQATLHPDAIAIRGPNDDTLSYRELDEASNRLAHYLHANGVQNTDRLGIYLERGTDMMVALIGILKSGASYVPMDPMFPTDRLEFMAKDADLKFVLTQSSLDATAPKSQSGTQTLVLNILSETLLAQSSDAIQLSTPQNEAYVIYTSGSTGIPKGVQIGHQALTNFIVSLNREPGLNKDDRLLAVTTISFDMSVIDLYAPLLAGAELVLASREQAMSPDLLRARIEGIDATFMSASPSTWKMLLDNGWSSSPNLKALCGGEPLTRDLADALLSTCKELWNMYGPTETTVYSANEKMEVGPDAISVGGPMANQFLYVLDESKNLVPIGVPGELYIGGDGVAIGYLHREELTAKQFLPDHFQVNGARMYRTGDGARWLDDGRLEVLGRLDDQVKLRGYRIEPGEIRARLVETEEIKDAVVIVREDEPGNAQLAAYLVPVSAQNVPDRKQLRALLSATVPEYMVPDAWVVLDELPLTPNGKIDRKQLPIPEKMALPVSENITKPRTTAERQVAEIWSELLNLEKIDVNSNFYELGGQSLQAAALIGKLQDQLELNVPMLDIFQGATVASIARQLEGHAKPVAEGFVCRLLTEPVEAQPVFMVGTNPLFKISCKHLDGKHPVYQLDPYALLRRQHLEADRNIKTIVEFATAFVQEIKSVQPHGPYLLTGGCEGALIAFEIGVQLQRQGDEVESLITWHTPAPGPDLTTDFGGPKLRGLRWLKWRIQTAVAAGALKNLSINGFKELMRHERVKYAIFSATYNYNTKAVFDGDMDIVSLTDTTVEGVFSEPTMGWKNYLTGNATVTELPGNHDTWLLDSADGFSQYLDNKVLEHQTA